MTEIEVLKQNHYKVSLTKILLLFFIGGVGYSSTAWQFRPEKKTQSPQTKAIKDFPRDWRDFREFKEKIPQNYT